MRVPSGPSCSAGKVQTQQCSALLGSPHPARGLKPMLSGGCCFLLGGSHLSNTHVWVLAQGVAPMSLSDGIGQVSFNRLRCALSCHQHRCFVKREPI